MVSENIALFTIRFLDVVKFFIVVLCVVSSILVRGMHIQNNNITPLTPNKNHVSKSLFTFLCP
jgi:hypothetical protein